MQHGVAARLADTLMHELSDKTMSAFDSCLLQIYDQETARRRIMRILLDADNEKPRTSPHRPEERSRRQPEDRSRGAAPEELVELSTQVSRTGSNPPSKEKIWDRRRHKRIPINRPVVICLEDHGGQQRIKARAVNVSPSGVLLEAEKPVPVGTVVILQTPEFVVLGKASVRHCEPKGLRYTMGLYVVGLARTLTAS
jgi:hypothetical protein